MRRFSIGTAAVSLLFLVTPSQAESGSNWWKVELPFEMPDWVSNPSDAFDPFLVEVTSGLAVLRTMGFDVTVFRLDMVPPSASIRVSSRLSDGTTIDSAGLVSDDSSWVVKAMFLGAQKAKSVQGLVRLEFVSLDMELGLAQAPVMKNVLLGDARRLAGSTDEPRGPLQPLRYSPFVNPPAPYFAKR